jgi:CheY-like chemotaxis protein
MDHDRSAVVLVVEDHEDTRALYVMALEQAGFLAHGVPNVAGARELLGTLHPDVLVADFNLPDGTAADIKKLCDVGHPKVCILVTGLNPADVDATGFDVVLSKPIPADELVRVIREQVGAAK